MSERYSDSYPWVAPFLTGLVLGVIVTALAVSYAAIQAGIL